MSWGELKTAVNSTIGANTVPLDVMMKEEAENTSAAIEAVASAVDDVRAIVDEVRDSNLVRYGSAVKSVQRGTTTLGASSPSATISISAINPLKSDVTLQGIAGVANVSQVSINGLPYVTSLTATVLSLRAYVGGNGYTVSWQIVEYY